MKLSAQEVDSLNAEADQAEVTAANIKKILGGAQ